MIGVGWEAQVAESRRRDAEIQRARANAQAAQAGLERNRAEEKAREADEQRREAEDLFGGVRDLANSMIFDVADQIAELQGATAARETLVRKAVEYLDRLSRDPHATQELQEELGKAYLKIGDLQGRPLHANLDDPKGAMESYRRSIALLEPLAQANPKDPQLVHLLIQAFMGRGRLETFPEDTRADFARVIGMAESRVAADPKSVEARHDLASLLYFQHGYGTSFEFLPPAAVETVLKIRAILEQLLKEGSVDPEVRRDLANTYLQEAGFARSENAQRSLELYEVALDRFEALVREFPSNARYRRDAAMTLDRIAVTLANLNRTSDSIEYAKRAISVQQQLADGDARNASFRLDLTQFQRSLAQLLSDVGKREEAMDAVRQALAGADRLIGEQPANPQFRYERARLALNLGYLAISAGDRKTAQDYHRGAESEMAALVDRHPDRTDFRSLLAQSHAAVGENLRVDGDRAGALAKQRQALVEFKRIAAGKNPGDTAWANVAHSHRYVALGLRYLGDLAGSYEEERKAIALFERLVTAHPDRPDYRSNLSYAYVGLAGTSVSSANWPAVIENASKALPFLEAQYAEDRSVSRRLDMLATPLRQLSEAYARQGDLAQAMETRRRLVRMREQFAALDPSDARRAKSVADELAFLAPVLWDSGDRQGCLDSTLQAIATLDRFPPEKLGTVSLRRDFATAYGWQIQQLSSIHEVQESVAASRKVLPVWEELYHADPRDEVTREGLSAAHRSIATNLLRLGSFVESWEHFQRSVELLPPVLPETASAWAGAAYLQERTAIVHTSVGDPGALELGLRKAIELNQHACRLAEQAWKTSPKATASLRDLYFCESAIMQSLRRLGDQRQALEYGRKAASHAAALIAAGDRFFPPAWGEPTRPISDVDTTRSDSALLAWQLGGEQADYTGLLDPAATPQAIRYYLAHGFRHLALRLAEDGQWQASMDAHRKSAEILEALAREDPHNKDYRLSLALAERTVGEAYLSSAERRDIQPDALGHARARLTSARRIALELEAERLLPKDYTRLPGQLASLIAVCEAHAKTSSDGYPNAQQKTNSRLPWLRQTAQKAGRDPRSRTESAHAAQRQSRSSSDLAPPEMHAGESEVKAKRKLCGR
jgi:tetratricopeptide (TPR) repeat protein